MCDPVCAAGTPRDDEITVVGLRFDPVRGKSLSR
jgi:hypothetical protein